MNSINSGAGKRALIFFGGWDGHEPVQCAALFSAQLTQRGFAVETSDNLACLERADLAQFDLIIPMWTMGVLSEAQSRNLVSAVCEHGCGLAGFHGGMGDAFRGCIEYQWMVGGQFLCHPDGIKTYQVKVTAPHDPIMDGIGDFEVNTEQYYMLVDPRVEVLATTVMQSTDAAWTNGVVMPCVWKKPHGRGRVFYSALGHHADEFARVSQQLEITVRGMIWAAR